MRPRATARSAEPASPALASPRLPQLDALRGVAAFAVVVHHAYLALPESDPIRAWCQGRSPLAIVTLGRPAVILFFTLSGFVLTLSLRGDGGVRYVPRRMIRLLPPFWAALAFASLLCASMAARQGARFSPWFNEQWGASVPLGDVLSTLPLIVGPGRYPTDHVVWSLVHEVRLSLLLPLVLLMMRRLGGLCCLLSGAALAAAAELAIAREPSLFPTGYNGYLFDAPGLLPSLVVTVRFLPAFVLGAVLASHFERVSAWATARPKSVLMLGVSGALLLSQPREYVMMLGSTAVVAAVATSALLACCLAKRPLRWLGRVSFSLYLVHLPIMLALGLTVGARLPVLVVLGSSIALSFLVSELFFLCVERPSIGVGRRLVHRPSSPMSRPILLGRPIIQADGEPR